MTANKQLDINNRRQTKKIYWGNRRHFGKKGTKTKASKEMVWETKKIKKRDEIRE